jgi:hypothetical protein
MLPFLETNNEKIDDAFRLALGDLVSNIAVMPVSLLPEPAPVFLAGLEYKDAWTRDAAINVWNGGGLLFPSVGRHTLLSVLHRSGDQIRIGDAAAQYWDAVIWTTGAWWHYLYTGDRDFLALDVTRQHLERMETDEFDPALNLFRGPASYADGISGYPDLYTNPSGPGAIRKWPAAHPDLRAQTGFGLPMHALSTNCLYYYAYVLADKMAQELNTTSDPGWVRKAAALKSAINRHFWLPDKRHYRYLVDPNGNDDSQEGLGHAFAILLGVAGEAQVASILRNLHVTACGLPCSWPVYERYKRLGQGVFGHHNGVIWPQINGFWAHAALVSGRADLFSQELLKQAELAVNNGQFMEIYHPVTGEPYGGEQEGCNWHSCRRQTWAATAYLRMVLRGLVGLDFSPTGMSLTPCLPPGLERVRLSGLRYREMELDIKISGPGTRITACRINGETVTPVFLPAGKSGLNKIEIVVS